ncbi:MAG: PQQ-binding-like beta-propeller repeat protein [Actinomycetia bacterium]|nr:PQQ-binding-like beta-propeller repeat protein [Actinomycetes bacterium]MCH9761371.1 PQQ-binding-like beta-propeller repeat protein [Actinomycetes bacterium]
MLRRIIALSASALITGVLAGCGNTDSWVQARAATGWAAQYGNADNSSYSPVSGADALRLEWTRSIKGDLAAQAALGSGSQLAVAGHTDAGCSLMVWEADNQARQRWCTRLVQGGGPGGPQASPLFDGFDNLYVGQPGAVMSFPPTQWVRWRRPVIGMPMTMRFLSPGDLLVVTHLGQVLVFDAHRGTVTGTSLDLVAGLDPTDSQRGLDDCRPARPECPVATAPAFSDATDIVVLTLWEPGADTPVLVGLKYRPGRTPLLTREWTSDAVGNGPLASPALSADGSTVYVNGRDERLWAINTEDGTEKWSVPLNYLAQTPPSVTPDGLIVAGGGPGARLMAIRDTGDEGEPVWNRDDASPLSTSSLAGVGYTVVSDGSDPAGMALVIFDLGDGRTLNSYRLAGASGWPVGVSIGHDRRIVTATSDGRVYGFVPA